MRGDTLGWDEGSVSSFLEAMKEMVRSYHFPRPWLRGVQGAVLAFGAPLGCLLISVLGGATIAAEISVHAGHYIYMTGGAFVVFFVFGFSIGRMEERLEALVLTDHITNLKNVRYFRARLDEEIAHAQRTKQPLSIMVADLDRFKDINDQYGHAAGDQVLVAVARAFAATARTSDTVARVGGEEFGFILPECGEAEAFIAAERVRKQLCELSVLIPATEEIVRITISIGVATISDATHEVTAQAFFVAADQAMYEAKRNGRNKVSVAANPASLPQTNELEPVQP